MMGTEDCATAGTSAALSAGIECFRYADANLDTLRGINMDLDHGSLTVVIGDSGSGKSTLGAVLAGMLPRQGADFCTGVLDLAGQRVEYSGDDLPRIDLAGWASHVGCLPQEAGHYLSRIRETVAEELAFSLENAGMPREAMRQRITELSQRLNLDHLLQRDPSQLSGGQERLVALAALAVSEPSIMILDEPLAGLDSKAEDTVTSMIARLRADGVTLVILSRTAEPWAATADALWTLKDGTLHAAKAGNVRKSPGPAPSSQRSTPGRVNALLEFEGVQLGYEKSTRPVVQGLDLQVRTGECVALAGANGAGKTTILKAAAGLLRPTGGKLAVRAAAGMLLQNPSDQLFERTVIREVSFGLPKTKKTRELVAKVLKQLGLESYGQTHPYELPASARRLVALATVMVREPNLLLLDEPTEALDSTGLRILRDVIASVVDRGGAVLFSSHDEQFIEQMADRVYVLPAGESATRGS